MRNKWLWLAVVLAVVIAAFLFPRVMLWMEQKNAQDYVLSHGMGTLLNFDELKLSEKQSLLAKGSLTYVEEQDANTGEILEDFYSELETLHSCGALSEGIYALSLEAFASDRVTLSVRRALDSAGASFHLCEITGEMASAYYDTETGKVLGLAFYNGIDVFSAFYDAESKAVAPAENLQAQLRSWAEYYGMRAGVLVVNDLQGASFSAFAQCTMHDSTDGSFTFAARVSEEYGIIFFAAVPNETDSIQEGA